MLSGNTVDRSGVESEICQIQLSSPNTQIWQNPGRKSLIFGVKANIVTIDRKIWAVIPARERCPIVSSQKRGEASVREEACHRHQLTIFGVGHGRNHILHVLKAGCGKVHAHDLRKAPGGALQRRRAVFENCAIEAVVLGRSTGTVTAGCRVTNVAIVELSLGQTMKDVALEENLRAPIRQISAPRGFHTQNSPYLRA